MVISTPGQNPAWLLGSEFSIKGEFTNQDIFYEFGEYVRLMARMYCSIQGTRKFVTLVTSRSSGPGPDIPMPGLSRPLELPVCDRC